MPRPMPRCEHLPYALYRAEQVRELDRCVIEDHGIPGAELMERAGRAAYAALRARWPEARDLALLCGPGNNGGDGYVVARLALAGGLAARVFEVGDHERLRGAARSMADAFRAAGGHAEPFRALPPRIDLVVDALLGTGLERPLEGAMAAAVDAANAQRSPVLAIDIPTGLHADTGAVLGRAVRADVTISFIGLKQGMFTGQGPECCGEVLFDALDIPAVVYGREILAARRLDWDKVSGALGRRQRSAHKGQFGHVLIVGGAAGLAGAARLAGEGALRSGAGLVTLATHPDHAAWLNLGRPELMSRAVADPSDLDPLLARASVVAVGPGLGQDPWGRDLLARVFAQPLPLVVDADALNLLAQHPRRRDGWILTPHPGEAGRLLGTGAAAVEADRFAAVGALQARFGGVAVLKGAGTLIQGGAGRPAGVCHGGNPGMASGGTGDVLSGVIAAMIAQGLPIEEAGAVGVCLHAAAGDAAAGGGERGMLASDLIEQLRGVLNRGGA